MKGADVLIRCLEELNVKYIFGYPGGANLPIYDALYSSKKLEHILAYHEQGATLMADGCENSQRGWRLFGDLRSRSNQYGNRFGKCLPRFCTYGCYNRTDSYEVCRQRCLSRSRLY